MQSHEIKKLYQTLGNLLEEYKQIHREYVANNLLKDIRDRMGWSGSAWRVKEEYSIVRQLLQNNFHIVLPELDVVEDVLMPEEEIK